MTGTTTLADDVRAWMEGDPDPAARAELQALLDRAAPLLDAPGTPDPSESDAAAALADLRSRFSGPLEFGTAGLRGVMGAGPHRMNRAVVLRAAAGLVQWLVDTVAPHPRLVIGYDARRGSARFAQDTAAVAVAAGAEAIVLPSPLPTPLLAFAVQHLGVDAGVMVTASHNPKDDNGYKVYLGGRSVPPQERGAQIVPPIDAEIAARIAAAPAAALVPTVKDGWSVAGEELREAYLARLRAHVAPRPVSGAAPGAARAASTGPASGDGAASGEAGALAPLRIALTPMHGVGGETVVRALAQAGFDDVHLVPRQAQPDPDFPTVAFPNPEEPGAMDLAMEFATAVGAGVLVAVDPDADRCACAIPDEAAPLGWRQLTGDETGALLGEQAARALTANGRPEPGVDGHGPTLANSIVSSRLLGRIAAHHGLEHRETLTGFKWISRAPGLAFGYEEAIGFCVDPDGVRDKDGISASVRLAHLADSLRRDGRTLADALDELAVLHGLHHTTQLSVRVTDLSLIGLAMERLRTTPPTVLAGSPVVEATDLALGREDLPPTDGMDFRTRADDRVVVRPSGTEPKLKCYLEVIVPVEGGTGGLPAAREAARERMERLRQDVGAAIGM